MEWVYNGISYPSKREMQAARRNHYLELVQSGMNYTQAAKAVGVSKRTGKVWRNGRTRSTGRNEKPSIDWYRGDMDEPKEIHERYLSQDERLRIADMLALHRTVTEIAEALGRNKSTISREVRRNTDPRSNEYMPYRAQQLSTERLKRPKPRKVLDYPPLRDYVQQKLDEHWSPEQISHRLKVDFPDNEHMRACPETIYQAIYIQAKGQLKRDLEKKLRSGRVKRRPRAPEGERKSRFRDPMVMISERPAEVADRAVPGHWEGDLIVGANNKSAIGTLVERTSRDTILLHLPDGHDSEHVQEAVIKKMQHLPRLMLNSLTWDQGSELAQHLKIGAALDIQVYFCDPHSPWQRPTNENTNGLLRQYFPKGTDLSIYPEEYLDAVAEELNDRPRKVLGWRKPSEVFLELVEESIAL